MKDYKAASCESSVTETRLYHQPFPAPGWNIAWQNVFLICSCFWGIYALRWPLAETAGFAAGSGTDSSAQSVGPRSLLRCSFASVCSDNVLLFLSVGNQLVSFDQPPASQSSPCFFKERSLLLFITNFLHHSSSQSLHHPPRYILVFLERNSFQISPVLFITIHKVNLWIFIKAINPFYSSVSHYFASWQYFVLKTIEITSVR